MVLGILMKACNARYYKDSLSFWNEFVPQFLFMFLMFGYMDFLIIVKWLTYYPNPGKAPSIISTMINIPLNNAKIDGDPFFGTREYNMSISKLVLAIAAICVPWMLLVKPLVLKGRLKKESERNKLTFLGQEDLM